MGLLDMQESNFGIYVRLPLFLYLGEYSETLGTLRSELNPLLGFRAAWIHTLKL